MKKIIILSIAVLMFGYIKSQPKKLTNQESIEYVKKHLTNDSTIDSRYFSAMARLFSVDPKTTKKGGDLGWCKLSGLNPEFRPHVKALKIGQITDWIETNEGWYIFQLNKKRLFLYRLSMIYLKKE